MSITACMRRRWTGLIGIGVVAVAACLGPQGAVAQPSVYPTGVTL